MSDYKVMLRCRQNGNARWCEPNSGSIAMISLRPMDLRWIEQTLARLKNDVTLVYFTEETSCRHCQQEKDLLMELSDLASKLHLEVYNFVVDREIAVRYGVDKVPGTVLVGEKDYGVRYYGMPSDFGFRTFVEDVLSVSQGESGLSAEIKDRVKGLNVAVHLEVFTTPACVFSLGAIRTAHQLAVESDWVSGDMVDVTEFPDLVERYDVRGSPMVLINGAYRFYGAIREAEFVDEVLKGIRQEA